MAVYFIHQGTRIPLRLDRIATSSTGFTNKGKTAADKKIVVSEMYFGYKHLTDECRVSWDEAHIPKLIIMVPKHTVRFKMDREIRSATVRLAYSCERYSYLIAYRLVHSCDRRKYEDGSNPDRDKRANHAVQHKHRIF